MDLNTDTIYSLVGILVGIVAFGIAILASPKILNWVTPKLDEEKEIARGNVAVAIYFGLLVSSSLLGFAIIIASAIFAGFRG